MNKFLNFFTTILFVSTAILMSCGGGGTEEPPVDPVDTQGELVAAGTASFSSVTLDNVAADGWDGFTLTFTYDATTNSGTYTTNSTTASELVFPNTGTWQFGGTDNTNTAQIIRSDQVTMDLTVSATQLGLIFDIVDPNGRTLGGEWKFDLTF